MQPLKRDVAAAANSRSALGRVEAAALGMDDLRDGQSVALGRVRLIEQAGEKTEAYRRLRCRHPLNLVL
jgi:hypothetical protein